MARETRHQRLRLREPRFEATSVLREGRRARLLVCVLRKMADGQPSRAVLQPRSPGALQASEDIAATASTTAVAAGVWYASRRADSARAPPSTTTQEPSRPTAPKINPHHCYLGLHTTHPHTLSNVQGVLKSSSQ